MTISLPTALLDRAKAQATARGITLNELIAVAMREHLAVGGFRLITVKGELGDPQLDLDRTSAFVVSDDEQRYDSTGRV